MPIGRNANPVGSCCPAEPAARCTILVRGESTISPVQTTKIGKHDATRLDVMRTIASRARRLGSDGVAPKRGDFPFSSERKLEADHSGGVRDQDKFDVGVRIDVRDVNGVMY